jgi:urease subunit beta
MIPGEVIPAEGAVTINAGRDEVVLTVVNTGDRPIQVGSHFHLAEANPALALDRAAARGCHLAIPAGTSRRFEPGASEDVPVVPYAGARYVAGFRGEVAGPLDDGAEPGTAAGGEPPPRG